MLRVRRSRDHFLISGRTFHLANTFESGSPGFGAERASERVSAGDSVGGAGVKNTVAADMARQML